MARPRWQVAWFWPVLLLAGLAAIVVFRVWSGWATRPMVASTDGTDGRVEGEAADLAAAGRRLRHLQAEAAVTGRRLANLLAEISAKRRQVRTLGEMLAGGRLTECPPFLRDKTTVRALQKIILEAGGSRFADDDREVRLATAAIVARERLRAKLTALADKLKQDLAECERQAVTLRRQLHLQSTSVRRLRGRIEDRLGPSAEPAATSTGGDG